MLKICRPLSLDPTDRAPCLYLCRRPDVPQALSQSHEKSIYVMGGHNSPDDVLRTKKLLVPRAARASVLWWSYQESQQKKITEEQVEQSKDNYVRKEIRGERKLLRCMCWSKKCCMREWIQEKYKRWKLLIQLNKKC